MSKKLTAAVQAERVSEARRLLDGHCPRGEIKRQLIGKYRIARATADRLIALARQELLLELRETRDWWRARSLSVYASVIRDETASHRDRIRAQSQIDKLLGLHAPVRIAQTDTEGRDISPDEARARISSLAARVMEREAQLADTPRLNGPDADEWADEYLDAVL